MPRRRYLTIDPTVVYFESPAPLAVSQVPEPPDNWSTTAPLVFHGSEFVVAVPIGSLTDWASVRRVLAWFVEKMTGVASALVHDHCYRVLVPAGSMTYAQADRVLLEALLAEGVPPVTSLIMWDAVRLYSAWGRPGGRVGLARDLPMMVAVTAFAAPLAAPSLLLFLPIKTLGAADHMVADLLTRKKSRTDG